MSPGCLPTICYSIPLVFHQISHFLSSILCWKNLPYSFPYWSPSLVLITQLIRLWWLFLFLTSLCFPVWPKAYTQSQFSYFLNMGIFVCAGRVIQDSSKHCFLLHSLCMVGIKTYVGPNSSQLQQPLGLLFLLRAKGIWLPIVDPSRFKGSGFRRARPTLPPLLLAPAPRALSDLLPCCRTVLKNGFICQVSFQSDQQSDPAPVPDTWQQ